MIGEMKHSIPSPPSVLDLNRDGAIDVMFAIDLAGQIFRYDFISDANNINSATIETRTGGLIADLQETNVDRRFYNPLDAVFLPATADGAAPRVALVTGSGYRAKPLSDETAGNRFYVVYDYNINGPQIDAASGEVAYDYVRTPGVTARDEIRANNSDIPSINTDLPFIQPGSLHKYGYYFPLEEQVSEKVINPSLISSFQLIGVSYVPSEPSTNVCSAAPGRSRAYRHNLLSGDREITLLQKPGVSAAPVLVYILVTDPVTGDEDLKPIVVIGTEPFDAKEQFDVVNPDLGRARKEAWWESGRGNN